MIVVYPIQDQAYPFWVCTLEHAAYGICSFHKVMTLQQDNIVQLPKYTCTGWSPNLQCMAFSNRLQGHDQL